MRERPQIQVTVPDVGIITFRIVPILNDGEPTLSPEKLFDRAREKDALFPQSYADALLNELKQRPDALRQGNEENIFIYLPGSAEKDAREKTRVPYIARNEAGWFMSFDILDPHIMFFSQKNYFARIIPTATQEKTEAVSQKPASSDNRQIFALFIFVGLILYGIGHFLYTEFIQENPARTTQVRIITALLKILLSLLSMKFIIWFNRKLKTNKEPSFQLRHSDDKNKPPQD